MPALAVRVDGLWVDGDKRGWKFRYGSAFGKTLRVGVPHMIESSLALRHNGGDTVEEHVGRREERQGHVMMLMVVPRDVSGHPLSNFLLVVKTGRHVGLGLHRAETRLGMRIVVGYLRATEARSNGMLRERVLQQGRSHGRPAVRVHA